MIMLQSEKRYRDLYNNAPIAYFSVNAAGGSIADCNKAARRLLGYSKKSMLQMKVFEFYADTPHGLPKAQKVFKDFKAGKSIRNIELQVKQRNGHLIWVSLSVEPEQDRHGKTIRSRSMLVDISARKQAEKALRQAHKNVQKLVEKRTAELAEAIGQLKREIEERKQAEVARQESETNFRALAENANSGILLAAGEGVTVYANKMCAEITGYTVSEFMKISIRELIHPDELEKITERFYKRLAGEDVPARYESSLIRKDGETIPIEVAASKMIWQGQPAVMAIFKDISDRKRTEEKLKKAHDELERRVEERTLELVEASAEIEHKHKELLHHKLELQSANQELVDINKALSALARNLDKNRQEREITIAKTIISKIAPIVENLRKADTFDSLQSELDILTTHVQTITNDLMNGMNVMASLTPTEVQVATMIKNGLRTQDIAKKLYTSLHTAKTHRRNIRKKLNVRNSSINLTSYLRSIM